MGTAETSIDFHTVTRRFGKFDTTPITVPDTGNFGTASIPVPDPSVRTLEYFGKCTSAVSSVYPYRYRTLG